MVHIDHYMELCRSNFLITWHTQVIWHSHRKKENWTCCKHIRIWSVRSIRVMGLIWFYSMYVWGVSKDNRGHALWDRTVKVSRTWYAQTVYKRLDVAFRYEKWNKAHYSVRSAGTTALSSGCLKVYEKITTLKHNFCDFTALSPSFF